MAYLSMNQLHFQRMYRALDFCTLWGYVPSTQQSSYIVIFPALTKELVIRTRNR